MVEEDTGKIIVSIELIRELEKHWHEQELIFRVIEKQIKEIDQKE